MLMVSGSLLLSQVFPVDPAVSAAVFLVQSPQVAKLQKQHWNSLECLGSSKINAFKRNNRHDGPSGLTISEKQGDKQGDG